MKERRTELAGIQEPPEPIIWKGAKTPESSSWPRYYLLHKLEGQAISKKNSEG